MVKQVISNQISSGSYFINKATLTFNDATNGVHYYLTSDGINWEEVSSGIEHTFTNIGKTLYWKGEGDDTSYGELYDIEIEYEELQGNYSAYYFRSGDYIVIQRDFVEELYGEYSYGYDEDYDIIRNSSTVLAWVNKSDDGEGTIIGNKWKLYINSDGKLAFYDGNIAYSAYTGFEKLYDSRSTGWHLVGFTIDKGELRYYMDGEFSPIISSGVNLIFDTDNYIYIGNDIYESSSFGGIIDDVLIRADVLSDDVMANYYTYSQVHSLYSGYTTGLIDKAIDLSGTSDVIFTDTININKYTGTLSLWVKDLKPGTQSTSYLFNSNVNTELSIKVTDDNNITIQMGDSSIVIATGVILEDNEWSNLVIVWKTDGSTKKAKLYVNSIDVSGWVTYIGDNVGTWITLGSSYKTNIDFAIGKIDDLQLWEKTLSQDDIDVLYNFGKGILYEYLDIKGNLIFKGRIDNIKYSLTQQNGFNLNFTCRDYPKVIDKTIIGQFFGERVEETLMTILSNNFKDLHLSFWNGSLWSDATYRDNIFNYYITRRIFENLTTTTHPTNHDELIDAFGELSSYTDVQIIDETTSSINYAQSYDAYFEVTESTKGEWYFAIDCDDAGDVMVDGIVVASWYGSHAQDGTTNHNGVTSLNVGTHKLTVLSESISGGGCKVYYQSPTDISYQTFSDDNALGTFQFGNSLLEWSSPVYETMPTTIISTSYEHKKAWTVIKDVCERAGLSCFIDYDKDSEKYYLRIFTPGSFKQINEYVKYGDNLLSMSNYGLDSTKIVNRVIGYGNQESDNIILLDTQEDLNSQAQYWTKDKIINDGTLTTMSELREKIDYEIDLNNDIEISGAINAVGMPKLKPGGVINVDIPNTPLQGTYTINSYTHSLNSKGFTTSANLESSKKTLNDLYSLKFNPDEYVQGYSNVNNMKSSYTVYFDESPSKMIHSETRELDGKLTLGTSAYVGSAYSQSLLTSDSINYCELRTYENYSTENDIYFVTADGGSNWEEYDRESGKPHEFDHTGTALGFKIKMYKYGTTTIPPEYESVCLLYR